jgi:hypothetical protein
MYNVDKGVTSMITCAELKELLDYDPSTGVFRWKISPSNNIPVGMIAGSNRSYGYVKISVKSKKYWAHRLAWLWVYGSFPVKHLDHINGICNDNRIDNLRECNDLENAQNVKMPKHNTSGYMGVSRNGNRWRAVIKNKGKNRYLGYYNTPEEAHQAYIIAKAQLHTFQPTIRV